MKSTPQSLARQFCQGHYVQGLETALWRETFDYLLTRTDAAAFDQSRIQHLWVQYGGDLRARIKDDQRILSVLKRALPGKQVHGMTLYRGESWFLFDQDQIGFCWTASESLATMYAQGLNAVESGGVLLRCVAPALAILGAQETSSGTVYLCDPSQLTRMTAMAIFPQP